MNTPDPSAQTPYNTPVPGSPPVPQPAAPPAPPSKNYRPKWIIATVSVAVVVVAIVSAVLIDSRIKQSETLELLAAAEQAESTDISMRSDPRWEDMQAERAAGVDLCVKSPEPSCYEEVWARQIGGVNSIVLEYIPQMQRDILDVEGVSTLPWHGDIRTAQDAYLDAANVMLDNLKWAANLSPATKAPDWDQFDADLSTTFVIAKRRFIEIKFVPAGPQDVQEAIDRVFTD